MENEENWYFAQKYASKQMLILSALFIFVGILLFFVKIEYTYEEIVSLSFVNLGSILMIINTERAIDNFAKKH
jgi:hypothetical protein